MADFPHPDATLRQLLQNFSARRVATLTSIHTHCAKMFAEGRRSFQPAEVGKALAETGVMAASSYMNSAQTENQAVGKAWQDYSDAVDLRLDAEAPPGHPDYVIAALLSDPKRRGGAASVIRSIYKACRDRFDRGELNFSPAAVIREGEKSGAFGAQTLRGGLKARGYGELLKAWQKLVDERQTKSEQPKTSVDENVEEEVDGARYARPQRFRTSQIGLPDDDPSVVLDQLIKDRHVRKSTIDLLNRMQEVCQRRFDRGEIDFGRSACAREFNNTKVFSVEKGLTSRLAASNRFSRLLDAWQAQADLQWIDFRQDLPPTNPHSVFRRLREKPFKSSMQETLLAIHRICYLEHAAGHLDFSVKQVGKLLAARGVLGEKSLNNSAYDEPRTLVHAWDEFARPWLTAEGAPPPSVRTNRRKSHNPDLEWVRRDHPEFEEFRALASEWLQTVKGGMGQRIAALNAFFEHYLSRDDVPKTPGELLRRGLHLPDFAEVAATPETREVRNNYLHEFFDWVLLRDYSAEADDGELLVSTAFRNPLKVAARPPGKGGNSQSVRSPLPYGYIHTLRRMLAQGPTFRDWKLVQQAHGVGDGEIGHPGRDWYDVDRSEVDDGDPDCVWRKRTSQNGRITYQIWSPVRWVAVLVKLLTPLRTGQVRMLDSGESDFWKLEKGVWIPNDHPLADESEHEPWQQGALRRAWDPSNREQPHSTVLYVSTNKTADMDKAGPNKGYVVPWHSPSDPLDNVYYWLEKLRNWQAKYNPIKRRTSWLELGSKHISPKTDEQLRSYPETCFLFRQAEDAPEFRSLPITDALMSNAWFNLLEALQDELAEKGETHEDGSPITFVVRDEKGRTVRNDFPLHSLRVSLITALALDGGVPFEILQKLVGHTRLVMTLYYTKVGHAHMTTTLSDAAAKLDASKEASTIRFLRHTKHEDLIKRAICNSSATLSGAIPIHPGDRNPAGWMLMHHGLCLVGGNVSEIEDNAKVGGCYNGGPDTGTATKARYGPVPGGARNCVRCRWFVTEPHYLQALSAHFNNAAYQFDEARNRAVSAEISWQELLRAKARAELSGELFAEGTKVDAAERLAETTASEFSDRAEDLVATWRLIERCIGVLNAGTQADGGTQLVIQGSAAEVKAVFEEVDSELLQLSGVCDDLQLYPDLEPDKAVLRRSQLLDSALYNEGLPPMFMTLSEADQLKLGNALMQRLSRIATPENPFIGRREVVKVMDAGDKLSKSLGIDLRSTVSALHIGGGPARSRREVQAINA
jgi:hypothetical protein